MKWTNVPFHKASTKASELCVIMFLGRIWPYLYSSEKTEWLASTGTALHLYNTVNVMKFRFSEAHMYLLHGRTQHVIAFVDRDQDRPQEPHQELLCPAIFLDWDINKNLSHVDHGTTIRENVILFDVSCGAPWLISFATLTT